MTSQPRVAHVDRLLDRAMEAWLDAGGSRAPRRPAATLVKPPDRKSCVLRIRGAAPDGSDLIAKRLRTESALLEQEMYQVILPSLPVSHLRSYGLATEREGHDAWIFLEDAGRRRYSPERLERCPVAALWLATLHECAREVPTRERLPDRGPRHYQQRAQSARSTLVGRLRGADLDRRDTATLRAAIERCESILLRWSEVERLCAGAEKTLVHGDFVAENLFLTKRGNGAGADLIVVDWEKCGWGAPIVDLARIDVQAYQAARVGWPGLDPPATAALVAWGRVFRILVHDWARKPIRKVAAYERRIREALGAVDSCIAGVAS
jgi:aminoglycoside phosphotransferase (APT) family kinase protein